MLRPFLFIPLLLLLQCQTHITPEGVASVREGAVIKGLTLVAPPGPFKDNPMPPVRSVNADWVAVIPYGFSRKGDTALLYNVPRQWWGEREEGVRETIRLAKEAGLKVMLKPQIWVPGGWTGDIGFDDTQDWEAWEAAYREFLLFYADLAEATGVDLLCVGTELKQSETGREIFWRKLIEETRNRYQGPLTYAANWDAYQNVAFWDKLDYIGVDAYFPLEGSSWKTVDKQLQRTHQRFGKPVLFTEFGYLSVKGCTGKVWELEANIRNLKMDEQAQAKALADLFAYFNERPYWQGGFLWKWYPEPGGNYQENGNKDYTPQGKAAEQVVRDWYGRM